MYVGWYDMLFGGLMCFEHVCFWCVGFAGLVVAFGISVVLRCGVDLLSCWFGGLWLVWIVNLLGGCLAV